MIFEQVFLSFLRLMEIFYIGDELVGSCGYYFRNVDFKGVYICKTLV